MALKPIAPGQALTAANVAFARRDVTEVTGASLDTPEDLAGRVADHAMAPGRSSPPVWPPRPSRRW